MGGSCSFLATQPMCPAKVPGCSAEAQSLCSRQSFTKALGSTRSPGKRGHSENPTNRRNGGIPQGSLCHSRQPRPVYVQCVPPFKGKPRRQQEREQHGATTTPGFPKVIVLGEKTKKAQPPSTEPPNHRRPCRARAARARAFVPPKALCSTCSAVVSASCAPRAAPSRRAAGSKTRSCWCLKRMCRKKMLRPDGTD